MKTLLTGIAVTLTYFSSMAANTVLQQAVDRYMVLKDALVNSDANAAASAASDLLGQLETMPGFQRKEELSKSLESISGTTKLEKQRTAFAVVSDIFWQLAEASPELGKTVYLHFCPMKETYWLSYELTVKNPYYGSKMLSCGKVTDTLYN